IIFEAGSQEICLQKNFLAVMARPEYGMCQTFFAHAVFTDYQNRAVGPSQFFDSPVQTAPNIVSHDVIREDMLLPANKSLEVPSSELALQEGAVELDYLANQVLDHSYSKVRLSTHHPFEISRRNLQHPARFIGN